MTELRPRRATINDVAKLAGVSKGAVSRSMNGGYRISSATVRRVREAADQLGWRPSAAARSVNGAPAHALGFIIHRNPAVLDVDPFFASFMGGIEASAVEQDYSLVIRFVRNQDEEQRAYRDMFFESQVAGFLVTDLRQGDSRFDLLRRLGATFVVVGRPPENESCDSVDHDSDDAISELAKSLAALGHERVAHVSGDRNLVHADRRAEVFRQACAQAGLTLVDEINGWFTPSGAAAATAQIMNAPKPPSALFYSNDIMALGGLAELDRMGLRIPEDVSVSGFDGLTLADFFRPRLTTICCDYVALGRDAADLLFSRLEHPDAPAINRLRPAYLRTTESIAPPSKRSPTAGA